MRDDMREIRIAHIAVRDNLRASPGDIEELAGSIKERGVLQPVVVRRCGEGYELVIGHRRLAACKLLKMKMIPAVVRDLETADRSTLQLAENVHRADLSPYEIGCVLSKLLKKLGSIQNVGYACRKGRSWVESHITYATIHDELTSAGEDQACVSKLTMAAMLEFRGVDAKMAHRRAREPA